MREKEDPKEKKIESERKIQMRLGKRKDKREEKKIVKFG